MSDFDFLGAEAIKPKFKVSWTRSAIAIAAGALGAVLNPKHPILTALGAAAVASNTHAVMTGDRTLKDALKRVGRHAVAAAGSLSIPKYPAVGWVAGAVAGEMLIAEDGDGLFEEWASFKDSKAAKKDVIDAEYVEVPQTQGLVKA